MSLNHPTNHTESFSPRELILTSIQKVNEIPKVKFSNEDMDSIWDVSAESVEKRRKICYMNPCLGQTLLLIEKLKQHFNPEDISFWIETLTHPDDTLSFHFFGEIKQWRNVYITDFAYDNVIFIYEGAYRNRAKRTVTSQGIQRISSSDIQKSDSIFDIIKKLWRDEQQCRELIQPHLNKLKKDNTDAERDDFNTNRNLPPQIIVEEGTLKQTQLKQTQEELGTTLFSVQ